MTRRSHRERNHRTRLDRNAGSSRRSKATRKPRATRKTGADSRTKAEGWFRFFVILSICLMILIFWFSSQAADDSRDLSDGFYALLMSGRIPVLSWIAMETPFLEVFPLRKCAHATVYFFLGCSVCAAFRFHARAFTASNSFARRNGAIFISRRNSFHLPAPLRVFLPPFAVCFFYACTDEFHQTFVVGRSGEFRDVCIDSGGALFGILLVLLLFYLIARDSRQERYL